MWGVCLIPTARPRGFRAASSESPDAMGGVCTLSGAVTTCFFGSLRPRFFQNPSCKIRKANHLSLVVDGLFQRLIIPTIGKPVFNFGFTIWDDQKLRLVA